MIRNLTPLTLALSLQLGIGLSPVVAHDGHEHSHVRDHTHRAEEAPASAEDRDHMQRRRETIRRINTQPTQQLLAFLQATDESPADRPVIADYFKPFADDVSLRWDQDFLFVESNGLPDHPMMIGITAWQQQVPLPQPYTGSNAWRIPLHPVPASNPMSAKSHFFRGAIALAVNGVPIFNPIKNNGRTDTLKAGELDQWGGHCGRADDYHYHIAPVHLEKIVGAGNPIAVALDGYPIYGYDDPDGKPPTNLDWLNGHVDPDGKYHYHATRTYPYLNGGFYGEVVERGGQVDPQPRAQGVRPALPGLRGATITGFENPQAGRYIVRYEVTGEKHSVDYTVADNGSATFTFVSPEGTKTENYSPRQRGGADNGGGQGQRQPTVGDPITQALDRNGDGQVTADELGTNGGTARGRGAGLAAGGQRGPQTGEGPRQPWILVHQSEIDLNQDNIITRREIVGESEKAFAGYDTDGDGELSRRNSVDAATSDQQ